MVVYALDLAAIGITNQRATTIVWERKTGKPVANAIVRQDTRVRDDVRRFSRLAARSASARKLACQSTLTSPA